jgi:hypothetical protein
MSFAIWSVRERGRGVWLCGYIAIMMRKVRGGFEWKARRYDEEQRA